MNIPVAKTVKYHIWQVLATNCLQYLSLYANFQHVLQSNLFKSVQLLASAEMLHLCCGVKYACRHYQLHASSLLQLGEIEDITAHSVFHQPAPVSQH